MTAPVMFNRRIGKNELDTWINVLENHSDRGCLDRSITTKFLTQKDAMSFVSSVDDEIIGGTSIYRDRTRNGMVLASVAVKKEFRNTGAYSIIKSSLPFFRTVAIRDVEALVPEDSGDERLAFPGSLELDLWTKSVLERVGFEEKDKLSSFSTSIDDKNASSHMENTWDTQPNLENAKKLIWDSSKVTRLTNSFVWTALDFAASQGTLRTVTMDDSTMLVTSIYQIEKTTIVGLIVSDENFNEEGITSRLIAKKIRESGTDIVHFPLIGNGQTSLVESIVDELGGSLKRRSMTLMCRNL